MAEIIGHYDITPRCADCRFSSSERPQPSMIQPVLVCRHGPLVPLLMPVAPGHAQLRSMPPVVAPDDWCFRFEARILSGH